MGITTGKPSARCLDLTRLVSRVGRGAWTGIDRVEAAYLRALGADNVPLFALIRVAGRFAVLDPAGSAAVKARLCGQTAWGPADARSRLLRKSNPTHRQAVAEIRRLAVTLVRPGELAEKLSEILPAGTAYLNVGHSNISAQVFAAFRETSKCRVTVFLHDTIPLDYPQYQRPETVPAFAAKLRAVSRGADLVICNSEQTRRDILRHLIAEIHLPAISVAHLGVNNAAARAVELPDNIDLNHPYFVTLGTIEPRKNHTLLLNIWQNFADKPYAPQLFIIGRRGWNNRSVFDRLDRRPRLVTEFSTLSDGAVTALLRGARALLFPSFAEGFGLPAAEAANLGIPVICNDLPVFHEILGDYPIYADASDIYCWQDKIGKLASNGGITEIGERSSRQAASVPTWDEHFNQVLKLT